MKNFLNCFKKSSKRRLMALVLVVAMSFTMFAVEASAATLTKKTTAVSMWLGAKQTMAIKGYKVTAAKSSNTKIATVTKNGVVTAKKAGKATIRLTGKSGKKSKVCYVALTVKNTTISKSAITLTAGKKYQLKLNGTKIAGIKTTKASVATVTRAGIVVARAAGTATITLVGANKRSHTCKVTVKAAVKAVKSVTLSTTTPHVGETITAKVNPTDAPVASYSWYRTSGVQEIRIKGETSSKYTVKENDLGLYIYCVVTGKAGNRVESKETEKVQGIVDKEADYIVPTNMTLAQAAQFAGSDETIKVVGEAPVAADDKLDIDAKVVVSKEGTIAMAQNSTIKFNNDVANEGTIKVNSSATAELASEAALTNAGTVTNAGKVTLNGKVENNGTINNNGGEIIVAKVLANKKELVNKATVTVKGALFNFGKITQKQDQGTTENGNTNYNVVLDLSASTATTSTTGAPKAAELGTIEGIDGKAPTVKLSETYGKEQTELIGRGVVWSIAPGKVAANQAANPQLLAIFRSEKLQGYVAQITTTSGTNVYNEVATINDEKIHRFYITTGNDAKTANNDKAAWGTTDWAAHQAPANENQYPDVSDADKETAIASGIFTDREKTYTMTLKKSNYNKIKMDNFVSVNAQGKNLVLGTTGTTTVDNGTWDESKKTMTYNYTWNGLLSYHAEGNKATTRSNQSDNLDVLGFAAENHYFLAARIPNEKVMGASSLTVEKLKAGTYGPNAETGVMTYPADSTDPDYVQGFEKAGNKEIIFTYTFNKGTTDQYIVKHVIKLTEANFAAASN